MPSKESQQEQKEIEVTAAKALPDNQVVQEMHEYAKPNLLEVKNADPNRVYRYLSTAKINREGGNTRGWVPVIAGKDKEYIGTPDINIQAMVDDLTPHANLKNIPQQTGSVDTSRMLGDMKLHWQHKDWAKSREKTYLDEARRSVQEVTVRDEKDRAEAFNEILRKSGMSKSEAKRYTEITGGVMVMNPGARR